MASDLLSDRAAFVTHAEQFWRMLKVATAAEANKETAAAKEIVDHWATQGQVRDLLLPLLQSDSAAVRYAAAAHLYHHGAAEEAIRELRKLISDPKGLVAPTAKLFLMKRNLPLHE